MAHVSRTNTALTSKKISEESEAPVKFTAATVTGSATITEISAAMSLLQPGDVITAPGIFPVGTTILSVNDETKEAVLSAVAEKEGTEELEIASPIFKPFTYTSQPVQTDYAEFITGSVYSDQGGECQIQQSFEYPQDHEDDAKALENCHWDVVTKITVVAKVGQGIQIFALAPYYRAVFINGATAQTEFRFYTRAQEKGRV
jgi:hypothetical protein